MVQASFFYFTIYTASNIFMALFFHHQLEEFRRSGHVASGWLKQLRDEVDKICSHEDQLIEEMIEKKTISADGVVTIVKVPRNGIRGVNLSFFDKLAAESKLGYLQLNGEAKIFDMRDDQEYKYGPKLEDKDFGTIVTVVDDSAAETREEKKKRAERAAQLADDKKKLKDDDDDVTKHRGGGKEINKDLEGFDVDRLAKAIQDLAGAKDRTVEEYMEMDENSEALRYRDEVEEQEEQVVEEQEEQEEEQEKEQKEEQEEEQDEVEEEVENIVNAGNLPFQSAFFKNMKFYKVKQKKFFKRTGFKMPAKSEWMDPKLVQANADLEKSKTAAAGGSEQDSSATEAVSADVEDDSTAAAADS